MFLELFHIFYSTFIEKNPNGLNGDPCMEVAPQPKNEDDLKNIII